MAYPNIFEKSFLKNFMTSRNFLLISCFILLSGCAQYQYVFIDSHLNQNDKKEFIKENDTVMVKYTFSGENMPITITIYNKLQQPLYIDWERSAVIINNVQVNGSFYHDGQISFIAPLSYAIVSSNELKNQFIDLDLNDPRINVTIIGGNTRMIKYSYNESILYPQRDKIRIFPGMDRYYCNTRNPDNIITRSLTC